MLRSVSANWVRACPTWGTTCMQSQGIRTTWRHNHWLKESLVGPWRKVQCDDEHCSQRCSHPQTWGRGRVRLPSVSFTEMKSRDGLSGFLVNAGYTWTPRSAEGIVFYIWNDLKCVIVLVITCHTFFFCCCCCFKFDQVLKFSPKQNLWHV